MNNNNNRRGGRGRGRHNNGAENDLPPPPTMAQVLQSIEDNRLINEQLLEQLVQNTAHRADQGVTLSGFLKSQPPVFSEAKEPLDADDWLRTIERKFGALHVPDAELVNFATYLLEGAAGAWWESSLAMFAPDHVITWEEFRNAFCRPNDNQGITG